MLDGLAEGYRKIRNTVRFALSNLFDFDPAKDSVEKLLPLDQWASSKLDGLITKVKAAYENYEFHLVYQLVVDFCANELSAQYFDIQKDALYTTKKNGPKRRSAQTVLYRIAKELLVVLSPVTSFTAEEAFAFLPGAKPETVFLEKFPEARAGFDAKVVADIDALFDVRSKVLPLLEKARQEKLIGKSLEAQVFISASGATKELLAKYGPDLPEFFIVSQVHLADSAEFSARVEKASGNKCPRCWQYKPEVGAKELCDRCSDAVS
jgi:isoleucyl-tRNA synthetase